MTLTQLFDYCPSLFNLAISEIAYQRQLNDPYLIDQSLDLKDLLIFKDSPNKDIWIWLNKNLPTTHPTDIATLSKVTELRQNSTLYNSIDTKFKDQIFKNLQSFPTQLQIVRIALSKKFVGALTLNEMIVLVGSLDEAKTLDYIYNIFNLE